MDSEVPMAFLVPCSSFEPTRLEIKTLAPVANPLNKDTISVINDPQAPTAATSASPEKNARTATSAAWNKILIVFVTIIGRENINSALKIGPFVSKLFFKTVPP